MDPAPVQGDELHAGVRLERLSPTHMRLSLSPRNVVESSPATPAEAHALPREQELEVAQPAVETHVPTSSSSSSSYSGSGSGGVRVTSNDVDALMRGHAAWLRAHEAHIDSMRAHTRSGKRDALTAFMDSRGVASSGSASEPPLAVQLFAVPPLLSTPVATHVTAADTDSSVSMSVTPQRAAPPTRPIATTAVVMPQRAPPVSPKAARHTPSVHQYMPTRTAPPTPPPSDITERISASVAASVHMRRYAPPATPSAPAVHAVSPWVPYSQRAQELKAAAAASSTRSFAASTPARQRPGREDAGTSRNEVLSPPSTDPVTAQEEHHSSQDIVHALQQLSHAIHVVSPPPSLHAAAPAPVAPATVVQEQKTDASELSRALNAMQASVASAVTHMVTHTHDGAHTHTRLSVPVHASISAMHHAIAHTCGDRITQAALRAEYSLPESSSTAVGESADAAPAL